MARTVLAQREQTLGSFHRLSPGEIARLRPLRIEVVKVRAGDTVASLAAQMRGTERPLELFQLLNGLGPEEPLAAGARVKIVVD